MVVRDSMGVVRLLGVALHKPLMMVQDLMGAVRLLVVAVRSAHSADVLILHWLDGFHVVVVAQAQNHLQEVPCY